MYAFWACGIAYAAMTAGKWRGVVDGTEGREYEGVAAGMPYFSPNSQRVAFVMMRKGRWQVVVDGDEAPLYDGINQAGPFFSPDSKRVVYGAMRERREVVIVDKDEGKTSYDAFLRGSRFIFDGLNAFHILAGRGVEILRVEVQLGD
jgi:Tol biopolymer transport system component